MRCRTADTTVLARRLETNLASCKTRQGAPSGSQHKAKGVPKLDLPSIKHRLRSLSSRDLHVQEKQYGHSGPERKPGSAQTKPLAGRPLEHAINMVQAAMGHYRVPNPTPGVQATPGRSKPPAPAPHPRPHACPRGATNTNTMVSSAPQPDSQVRPKAEDPRDTASSHHCPDQLQPRSVKPWHNPTLT